MIVSGLLIASALATSTGNNLERTNVSIMRCSIETGWLSTNIDQRVSLAVAGRLNGHATQVMIDTGAPRTTISTRLADALRIPYTIGKSRSFLNAIADTFEGGEVEIELGEFAKYKQKVEVVDFKYFQVLNIPIDLVIGRDLLKNCMFSYDRKSRRIKISDDVDSSEFKAVKLFDDNGDNFLYTSVVISDGENIKSYIDTGSASSYKITSDRNASQIVGNDVKITTVPISSLVSVSIEEIAIIPQIFIDNSPIYNLTVNFAQTTPKNGEKNPTVGLIGRGVLERFSFIVDFKNKKLFIDDEVQNPPNIIKSTSGLVVIPVLNNLSVIHVMRNSPAERAGWKLGAQICAVDGQEIPKNYRESSLRRWTIDAPGRKVLLKLCNGETRTLTLEEFY